MANKEKIFENLERAVAHYKRHVPGKTEIFIDARDYEAIKNDSRLEARYSSHWFQGYKLRPLK